MALEIMSMQCSATISPQPGNPGKKSKRETAHHYKCQSPPYRLITQDSIADYRVEPQPEQDNASDCEALPYQCNQNPIINCKSNQVGGVGRGGGLSKGGKKDSNRKNLARGPRSGGVVTTETMQSMFQAPWEDHRVVSTEYQQVSETQVQVLMRVTLLAAGFVIGAKGNSARLIGQATGALVQSWTETDCTGSDAALPIRLFRIQGKKHLVQAAVHLIQQAVAKYRDLCECKRRGEFVQREHIINGVEFYYQPPPKKAFFLPIENNHTNDMIQKPHIASFENVPPSTSPWLSSCPFPTSQNISNTSSINPPQTYSHGSNNQKNNCFHPPPHLYWHSNKHCLAFSGNHVWSMAQLHCPRLRLCTCACAFKYPNCFKSYDAAAYHRHLLSTRAVNVNSRYVWPGLFHRQGSDAQPKFEEELPKSMNSIHNNKSADTKAEGILCNLEEKLEKLEIRGENEKRVVDPWSVLVQEKKEREEVMSSSLFSYFGHGEAPLAPSNSSHPFDFSSCEFLGGRFPPFSFASAINSKTHVNPEQQQHSMMCALCNCQQAGFRLMGCKHVICASCCEGHTKCPLCGEDISGVKEFDKEGAPSATFDFDASLWDHPSEF